MRSCRITTEATSPTISAPYDESIDAVRRRSCASHRSEQLGRQVDIRGPVHRKPREPEILGVCIYLCQKTARNTSQTDALPS